MTGVDQISLGQFKLEITIKHQSGDVEEEIECMSPDLRAET